MSVGDAIKAVGGALRKSRTPESIDDLREVWELHCLGNSTKEIAKAYGVTSSLARAWIDEYRSLYASEMCRTQRSMLLTDKLAMFDTISNVAMSEVSRIKRRTLVVNEEGEVVEVDIKADSQLMSAKARMLKVALDAHKSSADLLVKTGVLPSAAKDINISIMDANSESAREKLAEDEASRSPEEILASIDNYLTRSMKLVDDSVLETDAVVANSEVAADA
jgi:transposase-like protein